MDQIQDNKEKIDERLELFGKLIHRSPLYHSKPQKWKDQCKKAEVDTKYHIDLLRDQIHKLKPSAATKHVGPLKTYETKFKKLQQQYKQKQRGQQSLTQTLNSQEPFNENKLIHETINKGNMAQDRIFVALDSMDKTVEQGISLAAQTNLKLNQQIQQLDRMKDKVKDTSSALKRAQKNINYFIKVVECDKVLLILILLVVLALIAFIVLIVKKSQK